jgi:GT2 family glycosyltransferase
MISVVVPTRRRRDSVLRLLAALRTQDVAVDDVEVVVSVDGSDDGTEEAILSLDAPFALRVVGGPRRGRAAACNTAISAARGEVVLILDDDMEPAPACLRRHLQHHGAHTRVCVMGAAPVRVDDATLPAGRYMADKFDLHLAKLAVPGHVFALRDFYSGNTSIRLDVLREVGLFDEAFTLYGNEDLELSVRLRDAGVTLLYDREAIAYQHYEKDLAALARDTLEKGETAVLLARARPGTFDELQLADYGRYSAVWRALRRALLRPGLSPAALRIAAALERTPLARWPSFYVLLLDYFYWLGVRSAIADGPVSGPLAQLTADLRHGPIRLLLHR